MSRYSDKPLSFEGLKTVPIDARGGKVRVEDFARPYRMGPLRHPKSYTAQALRPILHKGRAA